MKRGRFKNYALLVLRKEISCLNQWLSKKLLGSDSQFYFRSSLRLVENPTSQTEQFVEEHMLEEVFYSLSKKERTEESGKRLMILYLAFFRTLIFVDSNITQVKTGNIFLMESNTPRKQQREILCCAAIYWVY